MLSDSERTRCREALRLLLAELDRPSTPVVDDVEAKRQQDAREDARRNGDELLTPRATCALFRKSSPTVRRAVSEGYVDAPFTLDASGKRVSLIHLRSASDYWGPADPDLLREMRAFGQLLGVDWTLYNVLNPTPLVNLRNAGEME